MLRRERAGRSAERRYKELVAAWQRRVLPRRFAFYFRTIYALLLLLAIVWHPGSRWSLFAGFVLGMIGGAAVVAPDALMPAHIGRWQLGAWGEQNTQSELKKLKRDGWTIRHDLRWGKTANHDHVAAGPAVFVLNSKNVNQSRVTIERDILRVTHLDGEDSYIADRWVPLVEAEARSLHTELFCLLGYPVHVYPVLVIWGQFAAELEYLGAVAVVRGDVVADWLRSRPGDLLTVEKREQVARAVRALPRA